jgi:hypothetical protein
MKAQVGTCLSLASFQNAVVSQLRVILLSIKQTVCYIRTLQSMTDHR